ncbi:hypothetical protein [Kribbella solani]|uniref:hypothetical protein n=1 Tax=Kribbella solani TaxID=236067 RepID=UPI0029A7BD50|nr:hypothetical protein [Kribbella solani]MDX2968687.1 hypothetical protein [Kribbella solani]
MAGDDREFEERDRRLGGTVTELAAGVAACAGRPDVKVHVIGRASPKWADYAARLNRDFAVTDRVARTLEQGLPGIGRGPGWYLQRAAAEALTAAGAEHALLVEAGEYGPLAVVTFQRKDGGLVVVGGGTTFPPGASPEAALPSAEEAGRTAQYALASMAAQEILSVSHEAPPEFWHGPRALESQGLSGGVDGQRRDNSAPAWTAADALHLAEQVTRRQAGGKHPFPDVESYHIAEPGFRRWATQLRSWIERGGSIKVYDHGDPEQRAAAAQAILELASDPNDAVMPPIPDRSGVRTMVAMMDGKASGLVTTGRGADGNLHLMRFYGSDDLGAARATELMLTEAAARSGCPVIASRTGLIANTKVNQEINWSQPRAWAAQLRSRLRQLDPKADSGMTEILGALDRPGTSTADPADPATLAASVQRFRQAGGHVLYLEASDPRLAELRKKVAKPPAVYGTALSDAGSLSRVLHPTVHDDGVWMPANDTRRVAVAVVDGVPVAAAAVRETDHRIELGMLAPAPETADALNAAIVEGVYARVEDQKPLVMFRPDVEARSGQLEAYGLNVTGMRAYDDHRRVEVRLPLGVRDALRRADRAAGWVDAQSLDHTAEQLTRFQDAGGSVRRLDHSVEAERVEAERVVAEDVVRGVPGNLDPVPPVNGRRVTVVAQSERHGPAYVTFDETPGNGIEVVQMNARQDDGAGQAARYWFAGHLAETGQAAVPQKQISMFDRMEGIWGPDESRYFLTGVEYRLGDRAADLLPSAPESEPSRDSAQAARTDQAAKADQAGKSRQAPGAGMGEAPRRPDGRPGGGLAR